MAPSRSNFFNVSIAVLVMAGIAPYTTAAAAQATPYNGLLSQFDEIVFGNVTSGSETEGRAVIGGNLAQSGSGNYCFQSSDSSGPCGTSPLPATTAKVTGITVGSTPQSFGALSVYGNVSGNNVNGIKGNIFINGNNTAALSMPNNTQTAYVANQGTSTAVGGQGNLVYTTHSAGVVPASQNGTTHQGSFVMPDFITTFQNPLQFLSTYLDGLTGIAQGTSHDFNATPTSISGTRVSVYDILGSNLAATIQNFNFHLNNAQTVVINVDGAVGSLSNLNTFNGQDNVIWNFYNQTSLNLPSWSGTILAPDASLNLTGVSQGDVISDSLIQNNNEIHNYAFVGDLSFVPSNVSPVDVDAPGDFAALAIGMAGLALVRRRANKI